MLCHLQVTGALPVLFDDLDLKKRGYNQWVAYGQSKTANIYMANEIERRFGSKGRSQFLSLISFPKLIAII